MSGGETWKIFLLKQIRASRTANLMEYITVYTRVQVEHVYKSNPIFEAKNTTFLEKV